MNKYELLFVLDPTLEETAKTAAIDTVKEIIAADGSLSELKTFGGRPETGME